MTNETQLAQLDRDAKALKPMLDQGKALENLLNNRDFKKLVLDGYLKDEAVRLVHAKADPSMQTPERQASITRDIDAIGSLNAFLLNISVQSRIAAKQSGDIEDMRAEILAEKE